MSTIDLEVIANNLHYKLHFDRRLNFIIGDSASGKTTLLNLIVDSKEDKSISVTSTYNIVLGMLDTYSVMVENSKDTIFIFDDLDVVDREDFPGLMKNFCVKNNLWFIIMSREDCMKRNTGSRLSFSIDSIYELQLRNNVLINAPYYTNRFAPVNTFDKVLIEDSTAGFTFLKEIFANKAVPSSNGKSSLMSDVESLLKSGYKHILVFIDTAAYGCHIHEFYVSFHGLDVTFVQGYECFEELLVNTNLLNNLPVVQNAFANLHRYANNFLSWERFFEYLAVQATKAKLYQYAHSSRLSPCYIKSCDNCNSHIKVKCKNCMSGNKIEGLLKGTKYAWLLQYSVGPSSSFTK